MNVLFLHQNYPGQFQRIARAFVEREGWTVVGLGRDERPVSRVGPAAYYPYGNSLGAAERLFPPLQQLGEDVRRGRTVAAELRALEAKGFRPDVIVAHPGWGDAIFVKDVYPEAALVAYLEYFYHGSSSDYDFDPEFPAPPGERPYVRLRNVPSLLAFESADLCVTPTEWQASRFPAPIRAGLRIVHEGVDMASAAPDPKIAFRLPSGRTLTRSDEVVTFVSRSLEPYRGFHVFMRALPELLRRRPNATVLVVGQDSVSYGREPVHGKSWRQVLLSELDGEIDPARVVFLGRLAHEHYVKLLQVSTVHVYLTYPFVLSWSLLEAMSTGCAIVASATGPVLEVIEDKRNGRLVDFFDRKALLDRIDELANDPVQRARLGKAARDTIRERYDFKSKTYPRYKRLVTQLVGARASAA